jgi:hypothetical protein
MNSFRRIITFVVLVSSSLVVARCSKGFESDRHSEGASLSFFTPGEGSVTPSTDKIADDCAANSDYDACIFKKNPVAQEGAAVADANSVRKFGVKLRGLSRTGWLENPRLKILTLHTPRASLIERSKFKSQISPGSSYLEQVSAYYYGNLAFEYLEKQVGSERLPIQALKIYADDGFTGFSSINGSIHLEKKSTRLPKAMSGEVVVQLIGQSLASRLSERRVHETNPTQHKTCDLEAKGCCASASGCSQALLNGFGDYVAAMIFPVNAKLGESISSSTQGQQICTLRRDLAQLATRTRAQAYAACTVQGSAVVMGSWYAAVWWRMRNQLEAQEAGGAQDIDKLFFDHARAWTGSFTFTDAKNEALRLSALYKDGKYTSGLPVCDLA